MLFIEHNLPVNRIESKLQLLFSGNLDPHERVSSADLESFVILKQINEQIWMNSPNVINLFKYQFPHINFLADFP